MSEWWSVIAVGALAAAVVWVLRSRRSGTGGPRGHRGDRDGRQDGAPRDFAQDREDDRLAHMSEEERTWQAASLQRNRDGHARDDDPTAPHA